MKLHKLIFLSILFLIGCVENQTSIESDVKNLAPANDSLVKKEKEQIEIEYPLDSFFMELDTNFNTNQLVLPPNLNAKVLFSQTIDSVLRNDGLKFPAKGNHDMIAYIPINKSSKHGWLYVSHETHDADPNLGDGGGATVFEVKFENNQWKVVGEYYHVDFSTVGNTDRNCGGVMGPNGMVYSCEEYEPLNNTELYRKGLGHRDTADFDELKKWENIGYVVEVDPIYKQATKKMYQWGRFYHEDLEFMDDGKTVYLSDDNDPAVFFKFVAHKKWNYNEGQLYAFKEGTDSEKGSWIPLPMEMDSLIKARDVAISKGATMYVRHEWLARNGDDLYIAETGSDNMSWDTYKSKGGNPAHYLNQQDFHGRILKFNTHTDEMTIWLECGKGTDGKTVLSNPDCIEIANLGGKKYLVIHEDIIGFTQDRVPKENHKVWRAINEIYFVDLELDNPTVDDAVRFIVAPQRAEMTGGVFTPDGETFFVNVQHPGAKNIPPYNYSSTVAITGWSK